MSESSQDNQHLLLTQINEFFDDGYVNMACTGPGDDPCPYSGIRQAVWVLHDGVRVGGYLCTGCGEDAVKAATVD